MFKVKDEKRLLRNYINYSVSNRTNFKSVHLLHKLDTQTSQINFIYMAFSIYCFRMGFYFQLDGSSHFEENLFYKRYDEQVLIFSRVSVGVKFLRERHAYKAGQRLKRFCLKNLPFARYQASTL